ncbi:multiple monosaccharide ABC transporter substrate-binding protein [Devosia sp.]|uniref:multiple monosaccharide ABC transporter substrate-binding protein n=1 Tax=Devosia sp. TaxID=1871048 RepID=UPI00326767AA
MLKTLATVLAVGAMALTASTAFAQDKGLIGISMPTKSSLRWISDGDALVAALTAKGYTVDLQYAEDDIPNQLAQIENMVTKGPKALIIAAVDGTTLSDVLQKAADAGAKVFAYDRLINQTPNVDYYTTFDNFGVGVLQANSLLQGLGYPAKAGPFNIELFGGSPDDNNAFFFYDGAMSVLQPLIDKGDLVVKSGQTGMDKVGTLRWDGAVAQARMDNILSANYSDGSRVDAVLSPYDGLSRGIISSLRGVGYGTADQAWPIISGQDAEVPSVKAIIAGEQYSTVFKDTRELAKTTAELVDTVVSGGTPEGLDTKTYNNKVKVVPSILLTPYAVDASNYQKLVVDSGYIKADDLK